MLSVMMALEMKNFKNHCAKLNGTEPQLITLVTLMKEGRGPLSVHIENVVTESSYLCVYGGFYQTSTLKIEDNSNSCNSGEFNAVYTIR